MPNENADPIIVESILESHDCNPEALPAILHDIQNTVGYLPIDSLKIVCEKTGLPSSTVHGVATFYSQFRLKPAGKHRINVCIGTACHVKGASKITEAFRRVLDISDDHDTDADGCFTVNEVACLGCCMLAPAVQIDQVIYGPVEPGGVSEVLEDFLKTRESSSSKTNILSSSPVGKIRLCECSSCTAAGAGEVKKELLTLRQQRALPVAVESVGCTGESFHSPLLEITLPSGKEVCYGRISKESVRTVVDECFPPASPVQKATSILHNLLLRLYKNSSDSSKIVRFTRDVRSDTAFPLQKRLATEHAGRLNPLDLDAYRKSGGFEALQSVYELDSSYRIMEIIEASGLRGRGGAGFPTGKKWRTTADAPETEKYLICNADEGDPGAFMDRMLLESFPFRVLEGILIAAHAVRAKTAFIYIRSEYPTALSRIQKAVATLREEKLLKPGINIEIKEGAGAFVCGEETALIAALHGQRGMPRFRPPYPSESGFHGKPTLINNAETFSLVPWIIRNGANAFRAIGSEGGYGSKSFALAGKIRQGGLVEVPMGISVRDVVQTLGGGTETEFKAVQIGGPSGGCLPASLAHLPINYDSLSEHGAVMGSGGMVVLDERDCMVDIARYFLSFTQLESCGKCTFCRIGTKRMLEILENITTGKGRTGDIEKLVELAELIHKGSLCGLGKTAPNPVLSTIRWFRAEYEAHLEGRCPAGSCTELIQYSITDKCIGCTICSQICPVDAIAPKPFQKHKIDTEACTRCDSCRTACPQNAVEILSPPRKQTHS